MIPRRVKWERVKLVIDSVETQVAKNLQQTHRLGLTEYRALAELSEAKDSELRMQELAKLLGLNQSSITRLVERLEKEGYTIRDLCPKDKRGVYTVLTERGREIYLQSKQNYEAYINTALDEAYSIDENQEVVLCLRQLISPGS